MITAQDSFGKKQEVVVLLIAFANLRPVAQIRPINTGVRNRHEYNLDASDSFDRDGQYGGKIVEYEFLVNNRVYRLLSDNMNYIFPRTGVYTRELLKNTVKLESQLIFAQRERAGGQNSEPALGSA